MYHAPERPRRNDRAGTTAPVTWPRRQALHGREAVHLANALAVYATGPAVAVRDG